MGFRSAGRAKSRSGSRRSALSMSSVAGPYRLWHHEHEFHERGGGTVCTDYVRYAVAFDFLVHRLFVRRDIERIFAYRQQKLRERFA